MYCSVDLFSPPYWATRMSKFGNGASKDTKYLALHLILRAAKLSAVLHLGLG